MGQSAHRIQSLEKLLNPLPITEISGIQVDKVGGGIVTDATTLFRQLGIGSRETVCRDHMEFLIGSQLVLHGQVLLPLAMSAKYMRLVLHLESGYLVLAKHWKALESIEADLELRIYSMN
jgi:hypothetical protein